MSVYFAAAGGFIKIGSSRNPERRVANLFKGATLYSAPYGAYIVRGQQVMLGYIPGSTNDERMVHEALSDFSVGLEWFIDEQPVRDYLTHLRANPRNYTAVRRHGGPVELPHCLQAGCNMAAQESTLRRRFGDAVADREMESHRRDMALVTQAWVESVLADVVAEDARLGRIIYDRVTGTITKTAKWDEDFPVGGVSA